MAAAALGAESGGLEGPQPGEGADPATGELAGPAGGGPVRELDLHIL